jgi:hypothetical protein
LNNCVIENLDSQADLNSIILVSRSKLHACTLSVLRWKLDSHTHTHTHAHMILQVSKVLSDKYAVLPRRKQHEGLKELLALLNAKRFRATDEFTYTPHNGDSSDQEAVLLNDEQPNKGETKDGEDTVLWTWCNEEENAYLPPLYLTQKKPLIRGNLQ